MVSRNVSANWIIPSTVYTYYLFVSLHCRLPPSSSVPVNAYCVQHIVIRDLIDEQRVGSAHDQRPANANRESFHLFRRFAAPASHEVSAIRTR